jgi:hypothetical protein
MTKTDFLKRWAKRATNGGAVEAFEIDLEKLSRTLIRCSTSAVVNGLMAGIRKMPKRDQDVFRKMIEEVGPAVERALARLYE